MPAQDYYKYTTKPRLDKAINSLLGILEGIAIDSVLNEQEVTYLATWLIEHQEFAAQHPFNELLPMIARALEDNLISSEEHEEIIWLCEKFRSTEYYSEHAADLQRLQSILVGIAADGVINEDELHGLSDWLSDHEHLKSCYPYDEVDSLIISALADQRIDPQEQKDLLTFFQDFSSIKPAREKSSDSPSTITGICAIDPVIKVPNSLFCFTGESKHFTRNELAQLVAQHGGQAIKDVNRKLNYLIVCDAGNPCWKYACYGLKIERAIELRKEGFPIIIVHERDFHDAIAQ